MTEQIHEESQARVLVVDDERSNLTSLLKILEREGFRVEGASSGEEAYRLHRKALFHVILSDLMMPAMSGIELMRAAKTLSADVEFVMMTAYGTIEAAVEAMREGAYDFIEKPLKRVQVVRAIRKAAERHSLVTENRRLRGQLEALEDKTLVGSSPALRQALETARQAAPSSASVLVLGESGTGKELVARYIHKHSERKGAFVAVNLAALPESIVEAELFGYERGAFTGAVDKRSGRLSQADRGTLFLDEIGDLPPHVQVKLLRVLQEGEYEPLGGKTQHVDFRLIAATHRDLEQLVQEGTFREDLYYRLNVIAIHCPRLAMRRDDISILAEHFIQLYCKKNERTAMSLTREAREMLMRYDWPGNVRELENIMERAVVLGRGATIGVSDLPPTISGFTSTDAGIMQFQVGTPLAEVELGVIVATLEHTRGDKQLAAQMLGISARTIYRKLDEDEAEGALEASELPPE